MTILIGRALKMQLLLKGKRKMFTPNAPLASGNLASGQTGTLLSVPEVDDTVYKITYIVTAFSGIINNMSLIIDGVTLESGSILGTSPGNGGITNTDRFAVCNRFSLNNSTGSTGVRYYKEIYCKSFSLTASASTTAPIDYAYEIGSYK